MRGGVYARLPVADAARRPPQNYAEHGRLLWDHISDRKFDALLQDASTYGHGSPETRLDRHVGRAVAGAYADSFLYEFEVFARLRWELLVRRARNSWSIAFNKRARGVAPLICNNTQRKKKKRKFFSKNQNFFLTTKHVLRGLTSRPRRPDKRYDAQWQRGQGDWQVRRQAIRHRAHAHRMSHTRHPSKHRAP